MFPAFKIVPQSDTQEKIIGPVNSTFSNSKNAETSESVTPTAMPPVVTVPGKDSSSDLQNSSQPDFDHATGITNLQQTGISSLPVQSSQFAQSAAQTAQSVQPIPSVQSVQSSQQKMPVTMQRDAVTHLNNCATFDTFVPGDSNRFARTVALAVAEGSGRDFNPLCIYGGSGLGKTHLLNAIGNYALVKDSSLKVRYVTSEEFTNEFIEALQTPNQSQGQIAEFNRRYREVDVLLIDDIQFLGGKEATLEQFFHTFNS